MPQQLIDLPLPRAVARLAWPAMTSTMLVNLFNLVDAFWVGRLGTAALGGMTASAFIVWCLHAIAQLVGTGVNAVVARRVGQEALVQARVAGGHGLVLALACAVVVMAGTLPFGGQLLAPLRLGEDVHAAAAAYLIPILWGFPVVTSWFAVEAIFRGSGDTRTPMKILGVTLLLNGGLDPLMMFGCGALPGLGIAGAAWATVLSQLIGVIVGLAVLSRRAVRPQLGPFEFALLRTLVQVGAPIALTSFLFSLIYILLTRIIAPYGSAPMAGLGVGHRIEGPAYFTCLGFSTAASTLVGQHLGARQPAQAARAAWLATTQAAIAVTGLSLLYLVGAPWIMSLFSRDPQVIGEGAAYLRIIAIFEVGMAFELVLEGAFSGAGNTVPPMLASVPLTALRVPAAHWLAGPCGLGVQGVWWAIGTSTALKAIVMSSWFRRNRWQHVEI